MNVTAVATELIEITDTLSDLLDQENALLQAQRVRDIPALQKEKTTLTGLYEARLSEATATGLLRTAEPAVRDRLRQASERFETAVKQNVLSLRAAMELNNRLVQTIAQAVERHKPSASGYTKSGANHGGGPAAGKAHIPVSLDKQL